MTWPFLCQIRLVKQCLLFQLSSPIISDEFTVYISILVSCIIEHDNSTSWLTKISNEKWLLTLMWKTIQITTYLTPKYIYIGNYICSTFSAWRSILQYYTWCTLTLLLEIYFIIFEFQNLVRKFKKTFFINLYFYEDTPFVKYLKVKRSCSANQHFLAVKHMGYFFMF